MNMTQRRTREKAWERPFLAEPEHVAALRRAIRLRLTRWDLPALADAAELCVTELITNVITHVGVSTPTWIAVSMTGTHVRVEVSDPDAGALPTPLWATSTQEHGRGLHLVAAIADRWGVTPTDHGKTTWCELATGVAEPMSSPVDGPRATRAGALLTLYSARSTASTATSKLAFATAEAAAIDLIVDVLHWLDAHGCDPDDFLDRAQSRYEAMLGLGAGQLLHR
ncbi:ATP-binding protein [Streptomyces syringium]|uniref:ATP-binding protein n=1 Tax=Streptomyces syringium TaxID=76729 RepID=UPI003451F9DF